MFGKIGKIQFRCFIPNGIIPFLKLAVIQSKLYAFEHIKLKTPNEIVFAICVDISLNTQLVIKRTKSIGFVYYMTR